MLVQSDSDVCIDFLYTVRVISRLNFAGVCTCSETDRDHTIPNDIQAFIKKALLTAHGIGIRHKDVVSGSSQYNGCSKQSHK